MITDEELAAIERRVQATGSANCWTGTSGAIAADCRRLVREIRSLRNRAGIVIGFTGPAGAGKDLAASMVPGAVRVGFSDPLYRALATVFGVDEGALRHRATKELRHLALCNQSPRTLLQTLGTDWGRSLVDPGVWVTLATRRWRRIREADPAAVIVVPDVRFENEAEVIRSWGGQVWMVYRDVPGIAGHSSEAGLPLRLIDRLVANTGTVDQLRERVVGTLAR